MHVSETTKVSLWCMPMMQFYSTAAKEKQFRKIGKKDESES